MFALMRKDLIACRLFLLIGLALYVLWVVSVYQRPLGYFLLNISTVVALVLLPIVVDDKYRIENLVCFLPPSRSQVVGARFVVALFALLIGLVAQYGLGAILSVCFHSVGFWALCSPQAVLVFCILPVSVVSLYLPCYFRLGLGPGFCVFVILIIALGTLLTSPLVATDFLSSNGGFVLTREMLQRPETALVALIDHVAVAVGRARFYATASIGSIALILASITLSIHFFNRRDV